MATWQDGPEYAPLERPDEFAVPEAAPLGSAPPVPQLPAAPAGRPAFDGPAEPVAPLAALVPAPADERDPQRPFDVVSSNLTAPGAWAEVHGSSPAEPLPSAAAPAPWPVQGWTADPDPAAPATAAAPVGPGFPSTSGYPGEPYPGSGYPPAPNGYPAPGTPEWFAPGAYGEQPPSGDRVDIRQVLYAVTPGLLIVLGLGVVISPLAPVLLGLAFVLCRRVKVAQTQVRRTLAIALGSLGAFAVIGLLNNPLGFGEWWAVLSAWSRVICLVTAVVAVMQVWARLKSRSTRPGPPPPPVYQGPWS